MRTRIAIPVGGSKSLDEEIYEHFGHAPYFVLVDIENKIVVNVETITNEAAEEHSPGDVPSLLASRGVNVVIVRGMGKRAEDYFKELGITVIRGAEGKIKDIIQHYIENKLTSKPYEPRNKWNENEF
jgi:predicted Fe-Mo cluster-binding NifX family protein